MPYGMPVAFGAGVADGLLIGISIKTGVDASHEGIAWIIINTLCQTASTSICGQLWLWGVVLTIVGIAALFEDIRTNVPAGVAGLVIGFFLAVAT